jgi:hypothetical protein
MTLESPSAFALRGYGETRRARFREMKIVLNKTSTGISSVSSCLRGKIRSEHEVFFRIRAAIKVFSPSSLL